jgi:hypothetical protein
MGWVRWIPNRTLDCPSSTSLYPDVGSGKPGRKDEDERKSMRRRRTYPQAIPCARVEVIPKDVPVW